MILFFSSLKSYFIRYKWLFSIGILCTICSDFLAVLSPQTTGLVIDMLSDEQSPRYISELIKILHNYLNSKSSIQKIVLASLTVFLLAIGRGLFMYLMRKTLIVASRKIEYDLKNDIYKKYQSLDNSFYDKARIGDLMNRITEDVGRIRMWVGPALMYIINIIILLIFSIYFMWSSSWKLTIISLLPFPIFIYFTILLNRRIYKCSHIVQSELSNLTSISNESFRGIKILQAFAQEQNYIHLFWQRSERYKKGMLLLNKVEAFHFSWISMLVYASILLATGFGGYMVLKQQISLSVLVEFILYINLLTFPCTLIGYIISILQKAAVSQQRVNDFLQTEAKVKEVSTPYILKSRLKGAINFNNIYFGYDGSAPLFENFSLNINPGEKLAIMGCVGAGKSTLVKLLLRIYDVQQGNICLDGIPITNFSLTDLRAQYSYAPQETFLFSQSILDNLLLGKDQILDPSPELIQACKDAEIYTEIMERPKTWHSILGEQGNSLSGGQKQRLSIARALIHNGPIMIFDDTLSAIDLDTTHKILKNIQPYLAQSTLLHITHRLDNPIAYDRIIVLEQGKIIQSGTHESLTKIHNGWYAKTLEKQQFNQVISPTN